MYLVKTYRSALQSGQKGKKIWSFILEQYNNITGANIKNYRALKNRIPKGFEFDNDGQTSNANGNKILSSDGIVTDNLKPIDTKEHDPVNLLLSLVFKMKPYQVATNIRPSTWRKLSNEFNSINGSNTTYNNIRDTCDRNFLLFYHNNEIYHKGSNLYLLKNIRDEYMKSEQQKDNDITSCILRLVDNDKPHVIQYGGNEIWEQESKVYNSTLCTNL